MSLLFLLFNLPSPPWESEVTSHFRLAQPSEDVLSHSQIVPSWIIPSQIVPLTDYSFTDHCGGTHLPFWLMNRYPHSSNVPLQTESSSPVPSWSSVLYVMWFTGVPWLLHVIQTQSQLVTCSFMVKQSTFGKVVNWSSAECGWITGY